MCHCNTYAILLANYLIDPNHALLFNSEWLFYFTWVLFIASLLSLSTPDTLLGDLILFMPPVALMTSSWAIQFSGYAIEDTLLQLGIPGILMLSVALILTYVANTYSFDSPRQNGPISDHIKFDKPKTSASCQQRITTILAGWSEEVVKQFSTNNLADSYKITGITQEIFSQAAIGVHPAILHSKST